MPSAAQKAAMALVATLTAAGAATPVLVKWEGWVNIAYPDPAIGPALATACAGVTEGVILGHRYTDAECEGMVAQALVKHGLQIAPCLPDELPVKTRAAFMSAAYNIGVSNFCHSSMSRKALAGDLPGACGALSLWTKAGGRELAGLVRRRADEKALCLEGLA